MTDNFDKFFSVFRNIRMTHSERNHAQSFLRGFVAAHPPKLPIRVRLMDSVASMRETLGTLKISQELAIHPALAALSLVLFISIGTSYAAEHSLPGQTLYALKTRVNEPIQGTLAVSTVAKADWNATLATRRLEEAEDLAAQGKFSVAAATEVQTGLVEATRRFDESVASLSDENDSAAAVDAQSHFEKSLQDHEKALSAITLSASSSDDVAPLIALVRDRREGTSRARHRTEETIKKRRGGGKNDSEHTLMAGTIATTSVEAPATTSSDLGTDINGSGEAQLETESSAQKKFRGFIDFFINKKASRDDSKDNSKGSGDSGDDSSHNGND